MSIDKERKLICTQINIYDVDIDDPIVLVCPKCMSGETFDIEVTATFRYQSDDEGGPEDRWTGREAHLDNNTETTCLDCGHIADLVHFVFIGKT